MGPLDVTRRPSAWAATLATAVAAAAVLSSAAGCGGQPDFWDAYAEIVAEEDARGLDGLTRIRHHLDADDPAVRAVAVRALGRMEDPSLLAELELFLADPDAGMRASAAAAVAQAVFGRDPAVALAMLSARIAAEPDAAAVGALATSLGRLDVQSNDQRRAVATALAAAAELANSRLAGRLGLARGIEAFARGGNVPADGSGEAVDRTMRTLAATRDSAREETAARIRRLAVAALAHARRLSAEDALRFLADPDPGVRRLVVAGAGAATVATGPAGVGPAEEADAVAGFHAVVRAGLADTDASVRVESLRAFDRGLRSSEGCAPILRAFPDPDPHVSAVAIGLAAKPCPDADGHRDALLAIVQDVDRPGAGWRGPARALHSLATGFPGDAGPLVDRFAHHSSSFARAWAARAAALVGDAELLRDLAGDPDPNVRTAALEGLGAVEQAAARDVYAAQLGHEDPLLVMTAVRLLAAHAPGEVPVPALLDALARFTATRRETVRDVRVVLLDGIGAAGGYDRADLAPYLADTDPVVAARAAALANAADGTSDDPAGAESVASQPAERLRPPLTPAPPLTAARLRELERSSVVLRMAGLGEIVIALRPRLAATNADRFARLAEAGYFNDLVFHRVEPNFVIQGGSPHANEYAGAGPYSRDEISSQPHWRGTVGLSTRGRDTGDAQIFVNLVDNVRLDFNYTIYGEVVGGMDVVDAVQEGTVIEEARVARR